MKIDMQWFNDQVEQFKREEPRYAAYARVLERVLQQATRRLGVMAIVQTRAKTVPSFAEKALRKRDKYADPVHQLTDLCGARVIVDTKADVDRVCTFIRENFEIDHANSVDTAERLGAAEFGYRSVHYIVQFKKDAFSDDLVTPEIANAIDGLKAEVQVRTIVQHAWASIGHDRIYKSPFAVPGKYLRDAARIAALLENADDAFQLVVERVDEYRQHYDDYMTDERMAQEIELLQAVLPRDPKNAQLARRIARLQSYLGRWADAVDTLTSFPGPTPPAHLSVLGHALCKLHERDRNSEGFEEGLEALRRAAESRPPDLEALMMLADFVVRDDEKRAFRLYERAFDLDPTHPQALGGFLELTISREHNLALISVLRPHLERAVNKCRDQAEVGVNLPEALYRAGQFLLLLGRPYESLAEYARAVKLTSREDVIDHALLTIRRIQDVRERFEEAGWVRRFLLLAKAARSPKSKLDPQLAKLVTSECKQGATIHKTTAPCPPLVGPVVIVAGGCSPYVQHRIEEYRKLLHDAFQGFRGTVISGGTTAGVSGLVGELQERYPDDIFAVGYVPKTMPSDAQLDVRYRQIRVTEGSGFSAREPLQNWIDLLASGIRPQDVTLLGINGGEITYFEYRLAHALGAKVGVLRDSGRVAGLLERETDNERPTGIAILPPDLFTLQMYLQLSSPSLLTPEQREYVAIARHEQFRQENKQRLAPNDPAMRDWNDKAFPEAFRESNRRQADDIGRKLAAIGRRAVVVADREIQLAQFTPEEIELLAKMEHGRWNVERLLGGWRLGSRDPQKKLNPCLVSWDELDDVDPQAKQWDRDAVIQIPNLLKSVRLEIQPLEAST